MKKPPAEFAKALEEARAFLESKNIVKAAQAARQAYALAEEYLPVGHADRMEAAGLLGGLLARVGRGQEAKPLLREAGPLGSDSHDEAEVAVRNEEIALLFARQISPESAREIEEGVAFARKRLPADHPHCLVALGNLGKLRLHQEHFREAEMLFQELLAACRRSEAPAPLLVDALEHLAILWDVTGQSGQSEPLWREAVELQESLESDPLLLDDLLHGLARSLSNQGQHEKAYTLFLRCLDHSYLCFGEYDDKTLGYWLLVANTLQTLGQVEDQTNALGGAAVVLEHTLGASHPRTVGVRTEIARLLITLGPARAREAVDFLRPLCESIRTSLPAGHPVYESTLELLRRAEAAAGGLDKAG
ncbi:hypothetical protein ABS71_06545 [bacterium SCN 62-11]|nr:MAG: hypothetical protein ABS71_06545 [bacterium SCN 62-11]